MCARAAAILGSWSLGAAGARRVSFGRRACRVVRSARRWRRDDSPGAGALSLLSGADIRGVAGLRPPLSVVRSGRRQAAAAGGGVVTSVGRRADLVREALRTDAPLPPVVAADVRRVRVGLAAVVVVVVMCWLFGTALVLGLVFGGLLVGGWLAAVWQLSRGRS
jgi:hypothetical protein